MTGQRSPYGSWFKVLQVPPYVRRPEKPDCPKGAVLGQGPVRPRGGLHFADMATGHTLAEAAAEPPPTAFAS